MSYILPADCDLALVRPVECCRKISVDWVAVRAWSCSTILGFDYNLTRSLDLSAGYSYGVYSVLNTFSFGIELNVGSLVKKPSRQ